MKNLKNIIILNTTRSIYFPKIRRGAAVFLALLFLILASATDPSRSMAAESSWSHYVQGTYGDFGFGLTPAAGFSFRNDLIYNNSSVGQHIFGGRAYAHATQNSVIDLMKFFYFFDVPIISGRVGFGALVPGVINANADAKLSAGPFHVGGSGHGNGFADIAALPLIVNVNKGNFHVSFLPAIYLPTGYYNSNKLVSLGRNYYSVDLNTGFTWLDPKLGLEASFNVGYMVNSSNNGTSYKTGDEFHLDYLIAQHLSPRFGFGLTGYVYQQVKGDTGTGAILGSNKSSAIGYGPAVMYTPKVFGKDITIIGKWLHDTVTQNRFKGETVFLSFAFSL
ncbi:MAG: hypothetical protein C0392_14005 [Syntrophus sp. (in: bacteria)]|nr:hypothetical protein [Syntrophus sp. (in: bacteria)]